MNKKQFIKKSEEYANNLLDRYTENTGDEFTPSERKYAIRSLLCKLFSAVDKYVPEDMPILEYRMAWAQKGITVTMRLGYDPDSSDYIRTNAIPVGGYNIKAFHYRYIVDSSLKPLAVSGSRSIEYRQRYKKADTIEKLKLEIATVRKRIDEWKQVLEVRQGMTDAQLIQEFASADQKRLMQTSWDDIVSRGCEGNYDGDKEKFAVSRLEYRASVLKGIKAIKIDWVADSIKSNSAFVMKAEYKLTTLKVEYESETV